MTLKIKVLKRQEFRRKIYLLFLFDTEAAVENAAGVDGRNSPIQAAGVQPLMSSWGSEVRGLTVIGL